MFPAAILGSALFAFFIPRVSAMVSNYLYIYHNLHALCFFHFYENFFSGIIF